MRQQQGLLIQYGTLGNKGPRRSARTGPYSEGRGAGTRSESDSGYDHWYSIRIYCPIGELPPELRRTVNGPQESRPGAGPGSPPLLRSDGTGPGSEVH
eukprot:764401-Hanusia_phi.AAC.1